mmetsp:Transcript_120494/g.351957  ORF Transcript_120494/g.351957 Transcript_120494/m.351957 type:complete len:614 (-) Transcript_120494:395-2236(-)
MIDSPAKPMLLISGVVLVILTSLPPMGLGYPSYRNHVPNGLRVACPPDAQGCRPGDTGAGEPASVCSGLGHATCAGADLPLNPFGQALKNADFRWSEALCNADSDGDGFTNGEELGDPCCVWREGDAASAYMASMSPTHPGFASHALPEGYERPSCGDAQTRPTWSSPGMARFNPWEEQRYVDFLIKNYSVPNVRTDYSDFVFNFDDTEHSEFHIVFGIALVDQPRLLHHFVVTGCSQRIEAEREGTRLERTPEYCQESVGGFAGWAPGSILWDMPTYAGVPIGTGAGIVGLSINVHYTDGDIYTNTVSQDGIRIYYTPTLRNYTGDSTSVLGIGGSRDMSIPANKERYFVTRTCEVIDSCIDTPDEEMLEAIERTCGQLAPFCNNGPYSAQLRTACPQTCSVAGCGGGSQGLPVASAFFHAHLLGSSMYQTLTRSGTTWDLGSQSVWHYDDQAVFSLLAANLTLQPGDTIQSTCIFNSMGRSTATRMGRNTVDEMCFCQVNTVRPTHGGQMPGFRCTGSIWAGELGPEEDARRVAVLHPLASADAVWHSVLGGRPGQRQRAGCEPSACRERDADGGSNSDNTMVSFATGTAKYLFFTPVVLAMSAVNHAARA